MYSKLYSIGENFANPLSFFLHLTLHKSRHACVKFFMVSSASFAFADDTIL